MSSYDELKTPLLDDYTTTPTTETNTIEFIDDKWCAKCGTNYRLENELVVYELLQLSTKSPHILYCDLSQSTKYRLVLERCKGDLFDELQTYGVFTDYTIATVLIPIIRGLQYMHSNNVAHLDLKLENILLTTNNKVKLCDFGHTLQIGFEKKIYSGCYGTMNSAPPEFISNGNLGCVTVKISEKSDSWSLGVLIFTLMFGIYPFTDDGCIFNVTLPNWEKYVKRIKTADIQWPSNYECSKDAKDLITKLLKVEPSERLSLSEVLTHPFMDVLDELPT